MRPVGSDESGLPCFDAFRDLLNRDLATVELRCGIVGGFEELVAARVIHHADANPTRRAQRDGYGEVRYALCEIQAAADRIDDPEMRCLDRHRSVFRAFFREDTRVGKRGLKRRADLLPVIQEYATRGSFEEIVPISARGMKNLDSLMAVIRHFLPESERLFPANAKTDRSIEFRVGEVLREKLLDTLRQEVPYGLAVEVLALEEDADLTRVDAIIWVERDSQQGIVVGRRGERLKHMSTEARLDLEKIFERRFYLKARVKVKENWSDNAMALRQLGYEVPR